MERVSRRLWITVILLIALLVATNGAWLWYESQFETVEIDQSITSDEGDILYRGNLLGVGDQYGE